METDDNGRISSLFLIFHLDERLYGLPVTGIREIIPMVEITPLPKAPPLIMGVINLRGSLVPIIDLRRKLRLGERPPGHRSCIVVADFPERPAGFVADRVSDCLEIGEIASPEEAPGNIPADRTVVRGIGQHEGHIVILLNPETLLSGADRKALKNI